MTPGGTAVFKRDGYGLFQTLPAFSTSPVHGMYHFQQLSGSDVQLAGSDINLYASVSDAAFVKVATGTYNSTWQCADSQGFAYCLTSNNDMAVKTDGSVANTTYQSTIPKGTMATFTPTQLVVAGVSGTASTLYVSGTTSFTDFTIGVLPSSSFTEPIASPGSRLTHIAYYFGKLFWWKDQSFGFVTFSNQNDIQLTIVSNQIGTLDNSSAFWNSSGFDSGSKFTRTAQASAYSTPGGIYFRGQDNHIYVYDGYYLTRITRSISPTVTAANRRKANSWTQTTATDFNTGIVLPSLQLSTAIVSGIIITSSFSAIENSNTQWTNGSNVNMAVGTSSITLSTNNSGTINDPDFEGTLSSNYTLTSAFQLSTIAPGSCTVNPQTGSFFVDARQSTLSVAPISFSAYWVDQNGFDVVSSTVSIPASCGGWAQYTLTTPSNLVGTTKASLALCCNNTSARCSFGKIQTISTYLIGGSPTFYFQFDKVGSGGGGTYNCAFDNVQNGSDTITTGSFTSQVFNTGLTSSTVSLATVTYSATSASFGVITATSNPSNSWTQILTSSATNALGNKYLRYVATMTVVNGTPVPYISNFNLVSASSGTYYSAVNNAPAITTWSTLAESDSSVGIASITYYARSSSNSFTTLSSTPTWTFQQKNATPSISTGTYFQLKADFYLSAATETAQINDFTFNWIEGAASDKTYITYFQDAIWFSVSASTSVSTNNRIFYWDILNGGWFIYDIPANGFSIENNRLYFGDPLAGKVYLYGGVNSDNAASINSYWRSKSFLGQDPTVQNEFIQADFVLTESPTTPAYTYTLDGSSSTAITLNLFHQSKTLIQRNFLLPVGKIGRYYDFRFGDNAANGPWRLMAHRVRYNPLNWNPNLSN